MSMVLKWSGLMFLLLVFFGLVLGCGSAYTMEYENPRWSLGFRCDNAIFFEALNSRADFVGEWPGGEEEPWPADDLLVGEPE